MKRNLNSSEKYIEATIIDAAHPLGHAAEEYYSAMKVLDDKNIPREDKEKTERFSLVGRIYQLEARIANMNIKIL